MIRTKSFPRQGWFNAEEFWNASGTAFFRGPAGARIKVRYGIGPLSVDRQRQTLNGVDYMRLEVSRVGRMLIWVEGPATVIYDVYPGEVGLTWKSEF